jgi:dienelactone hydrolase
VPGFDVTTFTHDGRTHEVYRAGAGPAVIVMPELPGLYPGMAAFGRRLVDAGYRVYLTSLFGRPGAPLNDRQIRGSLMRICVSREFYMLADRAAPAVSWLRALAAQAHAECGGPGVGAVGMCFTGGYALSPQPRDWGLSWMDPRRHKSVVDGPITTNAAGGARPGSLS